MDPNKKDKCIACGGEHETEEQYEHCQMSAMGYPFEDEQDITPYGIRDEFGGL